MRYSTSSEQTAQEIYERGTALGIEVTNADRDAILRQAANRLDSLLSATATHKPTHNPTSNPGPSPK